MRGGLPLRIKDHPILSFDWQESLPFTFNGKKLKGYTGDSIAAALHANGITTFSTSLKYHRPRGFFCGIGKCSSCLMEVNGQPNIRTCITPLQANISVTQQDSKAAWPKNATNSFYPPQQKNVDILIIGAGPAGLEAAIAAASLGAHVLLVDENTHIGGQLVKQTHKFFGSKQEKAGTRGIYIADQLNQQLQKPPINKRVDLLLNATVFGYYEDNNDTSYTFGVIKRKEYTTIHYKIRCKSVIFAVGAMENMLLFPGNDLPGVYGAGAVQTLMNVYGVQPGKRMLMVGAGNVGLIVSYQLLQAGIDVACVVEAAPIIGGYHVHAAKLRRHGIPILTRHSIKEVLGKEKVEGAIITTLDEHWQPIPGSDQTISCDTVCLAVGLTPSTRLLSQMHVQMNTIPEAGGFVALHDHTMQTSQPRVYVAGDTSGIEEASTAMIEGKIAGISAALSLGHTKKDAEKTRQQFIDELDQLHAGPFGQKPRQAKQRIARHWRKNYETL